MDLFVFAYKTPPLIPRKTMKGKKSRGVIKVDNRSEVKHEEKYKVNDLMK